MSVVRAGPGLLSSADRTYTSSGDEITVYTLEITQVDPYQVTGGTAGSVLMTNDSGIPEWFNPLEKISKQNNDHPACEAAWKNVLAALREYETIVKLSKEEKNSNS